jgi:hypothetical protein
MVIAEEQKQNKIQNKNDKNPRKLFTTPHTHHTHIITEDKENHIRS